MTMALSLEIVTPEQRALTVECDEVRLPGASGGFGVRPGHTPLMAQLRAGELLYVAAGTEHRYAVGEGFAEISDDRVRVLVEEAQRAEDIDPAKVAQELVARQKTLEGLKLDDPAYEQERARVERAAARAFVAGRR
jgi:F-type H+-transporting ATPase subunit epsilon